MPYTIAFMADSHLGYSARCRSHSSGLNMRVRDGYLGFRETVDQILEVRPDVVIDGGDLFHRSHPGISDIAWARRQLERLSAAGIPVVVVTGNHDFANDRGKSPATVAVDDPGRGIFAVSEPYRVIRPVPGLAIHAVSHVGLAAAARVVPEPVDGEVSILTSHGAAQVPGHEIFATVDSPGEAVIGYDLLTMPWAATLLGHYHGMGSLPGFEQGPGQAWYAGSLLRRGFSDPAGGRGWLLVTVEDSGVVSVERRYISQRPQFDLPVIDAAGGTAVTVEEAIRENLRSVDVTDAIIRQRVINCPLAVRRAVDMKGLNDLAASALVWQAEFFRPAVTELAALPETQAAVASLRSAGSADLPKMFADWFGGYAEANALAETLRPSIVSGATKLLEKVSTNVDSETDAPARATNGEAK